jgi:hypothetical protein
MCRQEFTRGRVPQQRETPAGSRGIFDLFQLLRQVEIASADDAVFDEPLAGFRHLLVLFLRL